MKSGAGWLTLLCAFAPAPSASAIAPDRLFAGPAPDLDTLALRAYVWGMPLVEAALIRQRFSSPGGDMKASPLNRFIHRRKLAGPEMKAGVGPNNDTIYSLAWLDLTAGPLILTAPDFGDRYYTFSINQADSSGDQSLGQRTHGGQLPPLFIHGPAYRGRTPKGMVDVPTRSRFVNVAGRILVRSEAELPSVHAMQDRISLTSWDDWKAGRHIPAKPVPGEPLDAAAPGSSDAVIFYTRLAGLLRSWPPRPEERSLVQSFAALDLQRDPRFDQTVLSDAQKAALERGYRQGTAMVLDRSRKLGVQRNGWTINYRGPRFGTDYLLRAAVAKDQIFVTIPEEALYPIGREDAEGRALDGRCTYQIRFNAASEPPVDAFWSITAYDDKGHMIPNSIGRYSVGDRTASLVRHPISGITVTLSANDPRDARVNWLPVDAGPFYLMMRLYRPRAAILSGRWKPPAIERGECAD